MFWTHVHLVFEQLRGMADGFSAASDASEKLSLDEMFLLQAQGDVETLDAMLKLLSAPPVSGARRDFAGHDAESDDS